jgi:WD40 repeat protein
MVAVTGYFEDIRLFETGTRRAIGRFGPTPQGVRDVAFSPDDSLMAAAGRDGRVSIWDVATTTLKNVHRLDDQRVCSVEWLDASTLVALGCDGRLIRWQMGASPTTIWEQDGHTWKVRKTPAGMLAVSVKWGSPNLFIVDPGTGTTLAHSAGNTSHGARYGIAFSSDGRLLAASSGEGAFYIHDLNSMTAVTTIGASLGPGLGVAFHKTQPILVTSTFRGEVVFWDTETWERLSTVQAHSSMIPDLAISPDGRWLASIAPGVLTVFDLNGALPWEATGALAEPLEAGELPSPDRTRALRRTAAAYGAPKLALSLLENEIGPVERARLLTLADDPGAAAAWRHAADDGAVSPAALSRILAALRGSAP